MVYGVGGEGEGLGEGAAARWAKTLGSPGAKGREGKGVADATCLAQAFLLGNSLRLSRVYLALRSMTL